jgi:hypothetical protein
VAPQLQRVLAGRERTGHFPGHGLVDSWDTVWSTAAPFTGRLPKTNSEALSAFSRSVIGQYAPTAKIESLASAAPQQARDPATA